MKPRNSLTKALYLGSLRKPVNNKSDCCVNQKHWGKPISLPQFKCSGFFYVHYFNNLWLNVQSEGGSNYMYMYMYMVRLCCSWTQAQRQAMRGFEPTS